MRRLLGLVRPASAVAAAMLVACAVIWLTGGDPVEGLRALVHGATGDMNGVLRTLAKATPLILSGLAVAIALRAGLFNIGAEGQLLVGGLAGAWVGFAVAGLPTAAHLPLALAAGAGAGALWGAVPGVLRAWRGAHEVIVTIMMNYIAIQLTHFLVSDALRDRTGMAPATPLVLPTARLWAVEGGANFSAGFGIALAAAAAVAFLLRRTALGYEIRAVGLGPQAARTAGISIFRVTVTTMAVSGALAGLAGAVEVLAVHRRFLDAFSPGYGFDSIAVALLGGATPLGVVLSAVLFGGLGSGAIYMESWAETPRQIAGIVQAVVIIAAGARFLRRRP